MKKRNVFFIIMVIIILFSIFTGCRDIKNDQTNTEVNSTISSKTEKNTVQMKNSKFLPKEINVQKGETVTWINMDFIAHNVIGSSFESDDFGKGKTYIQTFEEVGTYDYICSLHANMEGKVNVK